MATNLTKQDIVRILPVNDLLYIKTAPTSPVIERTQKVSYSEGGGGTRFSPGDHVIINLQSGVDFIDPLQSFLVFDIELEGAVGAEAAFPGSILNIFEQSQISSRSGREMDRTEELNLLNYHMVRMVPDDRRTTILNGLMGAQTYDVLAEAPAKQRNTLVVGTTQRFMVPLKYLGGIFNSDKLMPPHLSRGLRIDLTLEEATRAFVQVGAPLFDGYTISNVQVLSDNYRMVDSVLEFLNAEFAAKKTGLVYEFFSWHTTRSTSTSSNVDIEVRRSVSMAVDVFATVCLGAKRTDIAADSFQSVAVDEKDNSQWRIGSHYLPNTPSVGVVEHFAQMVYWANRLRGDKGLGDKYDEFKGGGAADPGVSWEYGTGKYCATLQRNNIFDLSGVAINNSQTLAINASLQNGGGAGAGESTDIYVFLRHLRRAINFLESSVLET